MPYATNFDLDNFLALQPLQEIAPDGWSAVPIIYDRCATSPGIAKPTNSLFTVPPPIGPPQDALLLDDTFEERLHVSDEWVYVLSRLDMARQMPDQPLCRNVVLLANQGCGTTSLFRFIAAQEARTRRPVLYLDNMEWWFCVFDARQGKTRVFTGDATTGLPITRKALDWVLALVDFHHVCKYECTTRLCGNGLFVVHLSKSTDNYASDFLHSKHSALIHVVDPPGFADSLEICRIHPLHIDIDLNLLPEMYQRYGPLISRLVAACRRRDWVAHSLIEPLHALDSKTLVKLLRFEDVPVPSEPKLILVGRRPGYWGGEINLVDHTYDVTFATPFLSRMASIEYEERMIGDSIRWQSTFRTVAASGGIAGKLFEESAHTILARGGEFTARKLVFEGEHLVLHSNDEEIMIALPCCHAQRVPAKVAVSKCAAIGYYIPAEANNKTFDSIARTNKADLAFQMTVSTNHSVNTAGLRSLSRIFEQQIPGRSGVEKPIFIFALPTFDQPFKSGSIKIEKFRKRFQYAALEIGNNRLFPGISRKRKISSTDDQVEGSDKISAMLEDSNERRRRQKE